MGKMKDGTKGHPIECLSELTPTINDSRPFTGASNQIEGGDGEQQRDN